MKILFLSIEFSIGTFSGNGVYAEAQVRSLKRLNHQVLTICGRPERRLLEGDRAPSATDDDDDKGNVLSISLPFWGRLDAGCAWEEYAEGFKKPEIVQKVKEFAPDVVIGVDWHTVTAHQCLSACLIAAGSPAPPYCYSNYRVYLRSFNQQNTLERELIQKREGEALAVSMCSFVLSRSDLEYVQQHYAETTVQASHLHVLLPPLRSDMEQLQPLAYCMDDRTRSAGEEGMQHKGRTWRRRYLSCFVRASREKEPHRFVDAVCELQRLGVLEKYGVVPLVAGAGWTDEIGNDYVQCLKLKLRRHVPGCVMVEHFLGPAELAKLYAETTLNVHPCAYDAYGMTIVEAASQGAPTLLHRGYHIGAADLLDPASGFSFDTDIEAPPAQLAEVIEYLLSQEEDLRRVGTNAMTKSRQWSEDDNAATLVTKLQAALDDLLAASHQREPHAPRPDQISACRGIVESRGGIDVVNAQNLQYTEFIELYVSQNRPVILKGAIDCWRATVEWVAGSPTKAPGNRSHINIDFLEQNFGEAIVSVSDVSKKRYCTTGNRSGGDDPWCSPRHMPFAEYCQWWRNHNGRKNLEKSPLPLLLYLKDWHFAREFPEYTAYECHDYFIDDWLNEWYDAQAAQQSATSASTIKESGTGVPVTTSDYRFVYLGPAGTRTPLHADVLRSHSWSANIAGRKRWRLLSPSHTSLLCDSSGRTTAPDFLLDDDMCNEEEQGENGMSHSTSSLFPRLASARMHSVEVEQLAGEIIFVPSGWFHTVDNVEDCLSINHNWISSQSVGRTWEFICEERAIAAKLIADCRELCSSAAEFENLVQRNVRTNCSLDYAGFGAMVRFIAQRGAEVMTVREAIALGDPHAVMTAKARLQAAGQVLRKVVEEEKKLVELENEWSNNKEEGSASDAYGTAAGYEWTMTSAQQEVRHNEKCLDLISRVLSELH